MVYAYAVDGLSSGCYLGATAEAEIDLASGRLEFTRGMEIHGDFPTAAVSLADLREFATGILGFADRMEAAVDMSEFVAEADL